MSVTGKVTPLAEERARAAIGIVARAVLAQEAAISYSELARRLGMSRVNGQGLVTYLKRAAEICAEQGLPNISTLVVSRDSLERGAPMPSEGSYSADFYAHTGLAPADVVAEQDRVRAFDWRSVEALGL